jgi:hypothetical protein
MTNSIAFTSPKQGAKIKGLQEELGFRTRVLQEAKGLFDKAKLALAGAVDDVGAPADGRTVVFMYEASALGPPGVYFETFETKWNQQASAFEPRTREEGLAWAKQMAMKGHPVEIPPEPAPPTTLPTE